jgi:hypothetical protein
MVRASCEGWPGSAKMPSSASRMGGGDLPLVSQEPTRPHLNATSDGATAGLQIRSEYLPGLRGCTALERWCMLAHG